MADFLRSTLLLHEWGLNSFHLDFYPLLFLIIKHSGQEILPFVNIMLVIIVAALLPLE